MPREAQKGSRKTFRLDWRISLAALLMIAFCAPLLVGVVAFRLQVPVVTPAPELQEVASSVARLMVRDVATTRRVLDLGIELFDLPHLPPSEITGVLRLLYKQDPDLTVLALLDGSNRPIVEPVSLTASQVAQGGLQAGRFPVETRDQARFLARAPLAAARQKGQAFSDVYADPQHNTVLIAGARSVPVGDGAPPFLLVFERSLRRIQQVVAETGGGLDLRTFVVDSGGRLVVHPEGSRAIRRESLASHPLVADFLRGQRNGLQAYRLEADGPELVGAFQSLPEVDWAVIVEHPEPPPVPPPFPNWSLFVWLAVAVLSATGGTLVQRQIRGRLEELERSYEERAGDLDRVQASLLETRKLNAIGDLGAGVAHEFNNPVGGILGLTQLLIRKKQEGDPDLQFLQRIESEARRCKAITENLLRFSEQQAIEHMEPVRLDRVLDGALSLITSRLERSRINVVRDLSPDCPRIIANEGSLQRAFLNVLQNAETAMPNGGSLTLRTRGEDNWAVVEIEDTGRGIPPENLPRVFEPFFTTKDNWRGSGLGLWVVYQIVQEHQGGVSVASEVGRGTVVTFRFPRGEKRKAAG